MTRYCKNRGKYELLNQMHVCKQHFLLLGLGGTYQPLYRWNMQHCAFQVQQ